MRTMLSIHSANMQSSQRSRRFSFLNIREREKGLNEGRLFFERLTTRCAIDRLFLSFPRRQDNDDEWIYRYIDFPRI